MKLDEIRIDKVDPNPKNPRAINIASEDPYLNLLKDSIDRFGVMVPILVVAREGRYFLVDGERRFHASKAAGRTTIPAYILSAVEANRINDSELLYRMFQIHHVRSEWGPIQQCHALESDYLRISKHHRIREISDLRAKLNETVKELATRTGIDKRTAFDRIKFIRWPSVIKERLYKKPDDRSYSYIIEIEDKIIIPSLINYPEYFDKVSVDSVRIDLYRKLEIVAGRSDVRLVATYFRRKPKRKGDQEKVLRVLRQLHSVRDMTYAEAQEELEDALPNIQQAPTPTPRQLCSQLRAIDQKIQAFDAAAIGNAMRRSKAKPNEIVAAATSLQDSLKQLISELKGDLE